HLIYIYNIMSYSPAPGQYNLPPQQSTNLNKTSPPGAPGGGGYPGAGQYNYPAQGGYPPQQGGGGYPPQQGGGYPPQGYPGAAPQQQYPPQQLPPQQYPAQTSSPQQYPGYNSGAYGANSSAYGASSSMYGANSSAYGATGGAYGSNPYPPQQPSPYGVGAVAVPMIPGVPDVNYLLQFKGYKLDRKDLFSKSDPFLTISVPRNYYANKSYQGYVDEKGGGSSHDWIVIYRSETHHNDQSPSFSPITLSLNALCGGNLERPIKIEVWDFDYNGSHDFIGSGVSTLREMAIMKELRLVNRRRIGISDTAGMLLISRCGPV
ncbi:hypothetical protein SAMD00019534_053790, partial [Acytostelium subglobosum LB1]|uniref:hypothetical protein n=1 Tax=Acytostelium subglobosum LB1 TaxID=1410327 RepID=UPI000645235E